jgi:hypothetical protein
MFSGLPWEGRVRGLLVRLVCNDFKQPFKAVAMTVTEQERLVKGEGLERLGRLLSPRRAAQRQLQACLEKDCS